MIRSVATEPSTVISNAEVNREYRLLVAEAPDAALDAVPGQFFHLLCPAVDGERPFLRRPMSIYDVNRSARQVSFLYKVAGRGTRGLATLQPGDQIDALGPLGRGFDLTADTRHLLLLGRGVGLATLAPLARQAQAQGCRVTAVLSARSADLIMSREALEAAGAHLICVTDAEGSSSVSAVCERLQDMHADLPFDRIATCGSNRLFRLARTLCREWCIAGQVALEARMGCGTGMCQACVVTTQNTDGTDSYRLVCTDGPVFGIEEATAW